MTETKPLTERESLTLEKIRQEGKRAEAQALSALAEAKDFEANATKNLAEAESFKWENIQEKLHAEEAERKAKKDLTANEYHHKYNFTSAVDSTSSQHCMDVLETWGRLDPGCDIEIVFSSPGGSVIDGMALFDFIQGIRAKGHKVTTGTIGYAASMAGILLQAGDVRWIGREAYILIHEVSFGCVVPETKVMMADLTWKSAGDLRVGDKIMSVDEFAEPGKGNGRRFRLGEIKSKKNTHAALYRVVLENGDESLVSEGHPWLTLYKGDGSPRWQRTRNLNTKCKPGQ